MQKENCGRAHYMKQIHIIDETCIICSSNQSLRNSENICASLQEESPSNKRQDNTMKA